MVEPGRIFDGLKESGISCFAGVPDSLLKDFCAFVSDHTGPGEHVITANEGAAVALAAGHYLATGEPGLVYMQNSGIGNAVNPLLSLADPEVYAIPMVLMVGWRGEPERFDEPQHVKQGRVMEPLLEALELPYEVLAPTDEIAMQQVASVCDAARTRQTPIVLLVRAGTFSTYRPTRTAVEWGAEMKREDAIREVVASLPGEHLLVCTTGKASRELFELRVASAARHERDFLTVGSMGHCSQIALGIALRKPAMQVVCLDGDGSVIMHMGSMAVLGTEAPENFNHIVLNNGAHDSVGGQPTPGRWISLAGVADACGYRRTQSIRGPQEVPQAVRDLVESDGPSFLEIRVSTGARSNLGRPTTTPIENRSALMAYLAARR